MLLKKSSGNNFDFFSATGNIFNKDYLLNDMTKVPTLSTKVTDIQLKELKVILRFGPISSTIKT